MIFDLGRGFARPAFDLIPFFCLLCLFLLPSVPPEGGRKFFYENEVWCFGNT